MSDEENEKDRIKEELKEFLVEMFGAIERLRVFSPTGSVFPQIRVDQQGRISLISVNTVPMNSTYDDVDDDETDEFFYPREARIKTNYKNKIKLNYIG